MQYRLHIDIPLGVGEEAAINKTENFINGLLMGHNLEEIEQINYRLGHDEDRQKSNYLDKNENGHIRNKKSRIHISG